MLNEKNPIISSTVPIKLIIISVEKIWLSLFFNRSFKKYCVAIIVKNIQHEIEKETPIILSPTIPKNIIRICFCKLKKEEVQDKHMKKVTYRYWQRSFIK